MAEVTDHGGEVDGMPAFWRTAPAANPDAAPILYLHGVPTSSDDWVPFLRRTGAIPPDLPGFGRSSKRGDLAYDIPFYAEWLDDFLENAGIDSVRLVVHDWGGVGLAWAQANPERVERLLIINSVPFLPGYSWHRMARIWRTPVLGELAMGFTFKWTLRLISRESNATPGPMPKGFIADTIAHFDPGTQRAILRLYRSSPPKVLAEAGSRLGRISCPALVMWGEMDPYIPSRFADAYADAIPGAEVDHLGDAGHWPWLDRPDVIDRAAEFLTA